MDALLVTLGSHGDLHPFLAIGRALRDRGHAVRLMTNAFFAPHVRDAGLEPLVLGPPEGLDIRAAVANSDAMHPRRGPFHVIKTLMLPLIPTIVEQVRRALRERRADAVAAHPLCVGASWACRLEGVPYAAAIPAPVGWFNPNDTLVMVPYRSHEPGPGAVRFDLWIGRVLLGLMVDRPINRLRRSYGLQPLRHAFHAEWRDGALNLGMWSPVFRPPLPGDPPAGVVTGFPWYDRDRGAEAPDADLREFLDAGEPPIVFTLGTAAVHVAGRFYAHAAEACRLLNRRGLLLIGHDEYLGDYLPARLPSGVKAFTYAPFSTLFPRAAAIVHHGGIGTTAQALRSGRPTVVCPLAHDQFDNAARVKRLGASETLPHARIRADRLTAALRTVLEDPAYARRAADLGETIRREDGGAAAAELIEKLGGAPPGP